MAPGGPGGAALVDPGRYRENCVGSPGAPSAGRTPRPVALAHGTVTGTNTGRIYGAPATRRRDEASFLDHVRLADGLIVERVQQADVRWS